MYAVYQTADEKKRMSDEGRTHVGMEALPAEFRGC
jgi:hypothetical protein